MVAQRSRWSHVTLTQAVLSGDDSLVPAEQIGTRIAKRRHQLDLSQQQLAERVGVARDTVSMWERNKQYPHRHLGKLELILGVDLTGGSAPDPNEEALMGLNLAPAERDKLVEAYRAIRDGKWHPRPQPQRTG